MRHRRLVSTGVLGALLCVTAAAAPRATLAAVPGAPACPSLPVDNVLNADVSALPVHARSAQWLASMGGAGRRVHPDFGPSGDPSLPYGIPFTVVGGGHPMVQVGFQYAAESDPGPYPLGPDTPIEGGAASSGDRHALMLRSDTCTLYELYDAHYVPGASTAGSGAVYSLRSDALRPAGWTSADAAGLPIMPLLLRPDEVRAGIIRHAVRMTAQSTDRSYLWPARHQAGSAANPALPPMGARFRLRAGVDISLHSVAAQVVLTGFRHYGLVVADNGSSWYVQGSADPSWDPALVAELKTIPAADFEAVDESSLMAVPDSGRVRAVQLSAVPAPAPAASRPAAGTPTAVPPPPGLPAPAASVVPAAPPAASPSPSPPPVAGAGAAPAAVVATSRPPVAIAIAVAGLLGAVRAAVGLARRRRRAAPPG